MNPEYPVLFPFQFHKGTIKTLKNNDYNKIDSGFNSIKVRLKRNTTSKQTFIRGLFQFHKGTIKTQLSAAILESCSGFNSIKVRLKLGYAILSELATMFQFHKGTIKTR